MLRQTLIRLSQEEHLRSFAMQNRLAQSFALRFVAGETLDQAINAVRSLNARGMTATLDHLGENVSSREEALEATNAAVRMIAEVVRAGVRCNVSLKLTQLGLDLGDSFALDNMQRVLEQADESELFVRIDMESANYVDQTLDIFYRLFEQRKNVGAVIQSCLYRSEMDLERLIEAGARVRLVKGAYFEPPSVAFQAKSDVDSNYVRLMEILLARGNYPAIATHDASLIDAATRFAASRNLDKSGFEFQMLYGIRRDLQSKLVNTGHNMRIYVPFGSHWYPYLMRRMAERPANLMFVMGSIAREAMGQHG